MINRNDVKNIRQWERVHLGQGLWNLTSLDGKVRTNHQGKEVIDLEKVYNDSLNEWKLLNRIDMTKPLTNYATTFQPIIYYSRESNKALSNYHIQYHQVLSRFLHRYQTEHSYESGFKPQFLSFDDYPVSLKSQAHLYLGKKTLSPFFDQVSVPLKNMLGILQKKKSNEYFERNDIEFHDDLISTFKHLLEGIQRFQSTSAYLQFYSQFIAKMMDSMEYLKEFGPVLMPVQPLVHGIHSVIHPIFPSLYGYWAKEMQIFKLQTEISKKSEEEDYQQTIYSQFMKKQIKMPSIKEMFSQSDKNFSKIAFINLDGYECQFNLQFARAFRNRFLYVSFLKPQPQQKRLWKKIFLSQQYLNTDTIESDFQSEMLEQKYQNFMEQKDPQNYYECMHKYFYQPHNQNKNMLIFPLCIQMLREQLGLPLQKQTYVDQSTLIYQIMHFFVLHEIKKFNPDFIMISYSGKLIINDAHFINLIQELTCIGNHRLLYFPNLASKIFPSSVSTVGIDFKKNILETHENINLSYSFWERMMQFLKISSGTCDLKGLPQQPTLLSKSISHQTMKLAEQFMQLLGEEYPRISSSFYQPYDLQLMAQELEKERKKILQPDTLRELVPQFYFQLYSAIQALIRLFINQASQQDEKIINNLMLDFKNYRNLIKQLDQYFSSKSFSSENNLFSQLKRVQQSHFLEIAEESFEDNALLYFKTQKEKISFAKAIENQKMKKNNFDGLVEASFIKQSDNIKEKLFLYNTTSVLYQENQLGCNHPLIPIFIMNHLSVGANSKKFQNYCAFLERKNLNNKEEISKCKNIKAMPVALYYEEEQIIQNTLKFRTEWNYAQNNQYVLLYWPSQFDFIEAICCKIKGEVYKPPILNQVFVMPKNITKPEKQRFIKLHKVNLTEDVKPRIGCSFYNLGNHLHIFGGFYGQGQNYLTLQHELVKFDFQHFQLEGTKKLMVVQQNQNIYEVIDGEKPHSYLRTRKGYEIFEMSELCKEHQETIGKKTIVILGGYGENFMRPYSLVSNFYYSIVFDEASGNIEKIEKKQMYSDFLIGNTKNPTLNKGLVQLSTRIRQKNGTTTIKEEQLCDTSDYCRYRHVFFIQDEKMNSKLKFILGDKAIKIKKGQQQEREAEIQPYLIKKVEDSNNRVSIGKENFQKTVNLRMATNKMGVYDTFNLTHENVLDLHIVNSVYLIAIISHATYSQGKGILVECDSKNMNQSTFDKGYILLERLKNDEDLLANLNFHIVTAVNQNFFYALHGYQLQNSQKLQEYQIKSANKKVFTRIIPNSIRYVESKQIKCCYSLFFQDQNNQKQIHCINLISLQDSHTIILVEEKLTLGSKDLSWKPPHQQYKPRSLQFHIRKPVNLDRIEFMKVFYRQETIFIISHYLRKDYLIVFNMNSQRKEEIIQLGERSEEEFRKIVIDLADYRGKILKKTLDQYKDRGFIECD